MLNNTYYNEFFESGQQKINFSFYELRLPADDPVYTLKKVMEELDYSGLPARYSEKGRNAFNPIMMYAVVIYANMRGIRSVDRIVELCERDLAFIWLTGGKKPRCDAFYEFIGRRLVPEVLDDLHYQFVRLLEKEGLVTLKELFIVSDVKKCVEEGRTPVILSKYVDHSKRLYERLADYADKVFLLSGENSKKENREMLQQMNQVKADESMILVATGKLIGEGFDFPRLDTLIMATPVAWKGVVEQYAGRLNRDYDGKESVIIYDYVDSHIPMFDRMYYKRLKAYKQIGYDIYSGKESEKQEANAIFDIDNYSEVYRQDLMEANREVIISSPVISGKKVEEIMFLLKEKQEAGLQIVIVTWKPDMYGYGDSEYWMELQERMRRFGFEMNLVEDYCEHYCIIDREVVWYGSMNFLGKEDVEDNLMRVRSKNIASELLYLTFGQAKYNGEGM